MCGINGVIDPGNIDLESDTQIMRDAQAHRGPDDAGLHIWPDHGVGFGHRRLSIIDLSPLGHNPMSNEDDTVWITYNGEVYNYAEIRAELEQRGHVFRSQTDTEVIVHAYEEWGDAHIHRLRGMFAYAIYDRRPQPDGSPFRLLLVRDRLGIKPLYYARDGERFLFASELKAITAYPGIRLAMDRSAVFDYLTYAYIPAPKTFYQQARKLPAGHYLAYAGGQITLTQYWDIDFTQSPITHSEAEAVELVRDLLAEAIQLHMISDVPVGLFLSGGLDSSTVLAYASRHAPDPIQAFSIGFDVAGHSETEYARAAASAFPSRFYERTVAYGEVPGLLPVIARLYDEPFADGSAIPTLRVSEFAVEQVKVALAGDGGDEVFAGYHWYDIWMRRQALRGRIPQPIRQHILGPLGQHWPTTRKQSWKFLLQDLAGDPLLQYSHLRHLFTPAAKRALLSPDWATEFDGYDDYWYFRQHWQPDLDPITRAQYLDLKTYLPSDILTKVDRASMAVGLEQRPPLLDHKLVEAVFRIPSAVRFRDGEKKYLLKRAMSGLLPDAILTRRKKGFGSPLTTWLSEQPEWISEYYQQAPTLINPDALAQTGAGSRGSKQWSLLVLEACRRPQPQTAPLESLT